ncbi:MAG: Ig-like domain-containing protein, partial [Candidatus Kerfeldbacteria bacterium]|nr:Ig-like domain-containing protein [Candidatus Kerfeldbacteria bacterium]
MNRPFTPSYAIRLRRILASVLAVAIGFQLNLAALAVTAAAARAAEDTTAPSVAIDQPTTGATLNGTITIAVSASDDVGVSSVQLKLDDAP